MKLSILISKNRIINATATVLYGFFATLFSLVVALLLAERPGALGIVRDYSDPYVWGSFLGLMLIFFAPLFFKKYTFLKSIGILIFTAGLATLIAVGYYDFFAYIPPITIILVFLGLFVYATADFKQKYLTQIPQK